MPCETEVKQKLRVGCGESDSTAGEEREKIAWVKEIRAGKKLGTHLLRKQVPAEGDTASQRNRGKVGTLPALDFRPRQKCRNDPSQGGTQKVEEVEVGIDGANLAAIVGACRAELQELHHAQEILTGSGPRYPGHVLHFGGKRLFHRRSDERAAVRHEELQQCCQRNHENNCRHHRGITAKRAGAKRASSSKRRNA